MIRDETTRRRWLGGGALVAALLMLIAGETFLKETLKNYTFLAYWTVCLLLTATAIVVAFLDVKAVQKGVGREHRDLLDTTLKEIESDAKARRGENRSNRRNGHPGK